MIGQVTIGKSFGGVVRYVMEKPGAEVICQQGVRSMSPAAATADFNVVRNLRNSVKNVVWHTSLSFAINDRLTSDRMVCIGKDYLLHAGLANNQYLMVRHRDTHHQHFHIVSNRITWEGQVIDDAWCKNRTAAICDRLEMKYGLTVARNVQTNKANDKVPLQKTVKRKIHAAISQALKAGVHNYSQLTDRLKTEGIGIHFQQQKTGRVNGISFKYKGLTLKGSSIDRSFSFKRLAKQLSKNVNYNKEEDYENRRKD